MKPREKRQNANFILQKIILLGIIKSKDLVRLTESVWLTVRLIWLLVRPAASA